MNSYELNNHKAILPLPLLSKRPNGRSTTANIDQIQTKIFSVDKSVYEKCDDSQHNQNPLLQYSIWKNLCRPKIEFFLRQATQQMIATKSALISRGMEAQSNLGHGFVLFVMQNWRQQTTCLFLHCPFTCKKYLIDYISLNDCRGLGCQLC